MSQPPLDALKRFIEESVPDIDEGDRFGRIALDRGYLTPAQFEACLQERRNAAEPARMERIVLQRGWLTPAQVVEVMEIQRPSLRSCGRCGHVYDVAGHPPDVLIRCLRCGEELPNRAPIASAEASPSPLKLGKYVVTREIARGGMGIVVEAEDPELRRRVALKVLREDEADPRMIQRLHREAAIAAQLRHPNIVAVHEVGSVRDTFGRLTHFIAMDFIEGRTLAEVFLDRKIGRAERVRMVEEVARAVAHAHAQGIIHRDLKPNNVLVDRGGRVLLTDFGLARAESFATQLTKSNAVMGTPHYMAPEQIEGRTREIDARSDVYALGVILYEAVTGRPPFLGKSTVELFREVLREEPKRPSILASNVDPDLEVVCLKAMEKVRTRRYPNALAFVEDLARARRGEPIRARPPSFFTRMQKRVRRRKGPLIVAFAVGLVMLVLVPLLRDAQRRAREEKASREALQVATERRRRLEERMRPLARAIEETRPYFYIPGADIRRKLDQVEESLQALEEIARDGESAEAWRLLGMGWYFVGQNLKAEEALRRADANDPGVCYYLGKIALHKSTLHYFSPGGEEPPAEWEARSREWSRQAVEFFHRASGDWGGAQEIDRHVAEAFRALVEERFDRVEQLCAEGLERFSDPIGTEDFWILRGLLQPKPQNRIEPFTKALAVRPHYAWGYFLRGTARKGSDNDAEAIADYTECIRILPSYAEAYFNRGVAHQDRGEWDAAIADYTETLRLSPNFAGAYNNRGNVRLGRGDSEGALQDFDEALRVHPDDPMAYGNRGNALSARGDFEGALRAYAEALRLKPDFANAYYNRGNARKAHGDVEGAIADYTEAVRVDPKHLKSWINRGIARKLKKDLDGAITDYTEAIRLKPDSSKAHTLRGLARQETGDVDGAIADHTRAIELDPQSGEAYTNRGLAWKAKGEPAKAMADYTDAIRVEPRLPQPYNNRGNLRQLTGDSAGALADYGEAIRLSSNWPDPHMNRGNVHSSLGEWAEAIRDYEQALRVAPDNWPNRKITLEYLAEARRKAEQD